MSSTTQATAEVQALAEKLAEATKKLELSKAMAKAAADATNGYSTAVHAAAIVQEQEANRAYQEAVVAFSQYEDAATKAARVAKEAAEAQAKAAQQAASAQAEAAQRQQEKVEELSRLFAKAFGEEVPEKLSDTKKAFAAFGDQTLSTGDRAKGLFSAIGLGSSALRSAAVGVVGYAQTLLAMGDAAMQARVRHEQLAEQSNAVAYAMQATQAATGGAATEQDALSVRTALLNANLQTNATAIAQVLAFSREHRRAGESNADAANRVVQAIQGNAQAQAELGLRVRAGSTALEAQVQVMRQLEAANRSTNPSQQQAAERQQQLERGFDRAKNGIVAFLGEATQLSRIYVGLADGANAVADIQQRLANWWDNGAAAAARQAQEQSREQARQRELLQQQQQAQQVREASIRGIREEISLRTAQSAVESGYAEISAQISATQQVHTQRVAQQAALSRRYNESEEDFLRRQLDGLNSIAGARQQLVQLTQQQEQQRRASDELGVQATTLRNLGLQISSQVRGLSIQQSYNGLLREAAEIRRTELETQTEFEQRAAATLQALEQARQRAIQQAQAEQQARDARFGLGRAVRDARDAGVPGFKGFEGVTERTIGDEYARVYAEAFSRRRMGESIADYDNRRAGSLRRLEEIQRRNIESEIRAEENQRAYLARQNEPGSVVDERLQALQGSRDAFRGMREGIGLQLAMRMRERQATNALERSGGAAEGNLFALVASLEQQSTALLSQGGDDNTRRATQIQAEAQAVSNAINSYRELAQAQREAGDVGVQFEQRWLPAAERTRTMAQRMADFSVTAFQAFSGALMQHVIAMIKGQETFGEGMRAMVHETGIAIAQQAGQQALWEGAQALAAVAKGIGGNPVGFAEAAAHGVAAAAYLGIAAAGGIAAAVTVPSSGAANAAASSGASPAAQGSSLGGQQGGSIVYQYNYSGLLELPEAGRTILRAQRAAARNGHTLEG